MLRRLSGMLARMDPKGPAAPINQAALSKDPSVVLEAAVDPLMVKGSVRNKTAFEVIKLIDAAKESASKVTVPTLLVHGAEDDIAYPKGSESMKELLTSSTNVDCQVYDGVLHEVLNHKEHFQPIVAAVDKHLEAS
eukprot:jgi/Undpi1/2719/HiC_scaffold_14.g06097.m1